MCYKKIHLESRYPRDVFELLLKRGIDNSHKFLTTKPISGSLEHHTLNGIVNSAFTSDPFRNTVTGTVSVVNDKSVITLTISFGLINWLTIWVWFLPALAFANMDFQKDMKQILLLISFLTLFSLITALLLYWKLKRDVKIIEAWIISNCT